MTGNSVQGTVVHVDHPQVNVKPYLQIDLRTDAGVMVAVRAAFWLPFGTPQVAEGHRLLVEGRRTMSGYIKPNRIVNQTLGVEWRRARYLGISLAVIVVFLLVLFAMITIFSGGF
jgi:hypothetical protein